MNKTLSLYHSSHTPLIGQIRIRGNCGYGAYFARTKAYSKVFGDITYKVRLRPKNTLTFEDSGVKGAGFFNMDKLRYNSYVKAGYDSLAWYRGGKLMEFIALDASIIIDRTIV